MEELAATDRAAVTDNKSDDLPRAAAQGHPEPTLVFFGADDAVEFIVRVMCTVLSSPRGYGLYPEMP